MSKSAIQEIFISNFRNKNLHNLPINQQNAVYSIMNCRTKTFGGLKAKCECCGKEFFIYRSCGNRFCSKCTYMKELKWAAAREAEFVDVPYYHVVFTIPSELNGIMLRHQKECYNLLFNSVSGALFAMAKDSTYFGGEIGFISVLHTWGSNLCYHPHLHVMCLGVGLDNNGSPVWPKFRTFLFPVKALSKLFQGKFLAGLKKMNLPEEIDYDTLYKKKWVVYIKGTISGSLHVVKYLARYAVRIGITDGRIVRYDENTVTFRYKDYKHGGIMKEMTLSVEEFCRRFLQHVLPKGFRKVRFCGLLSNKNKKTKLEALRSKLHCRRLKNKYAGKNTIEILRINHGDKACTCPFCGSNKLTYSGVPPNPNATLQS